MNISHTIPLHEGMNLDLRDLRGDFFSIFNHGEGAIESTTPATGIVSDQFEINDVNNSANLAPAIATFASSANPVSEQPIRFSGREKFSPGKSMDRKENQQF